MGTSASASVVPYLWERKGVEEEEERDPKRERERERERVVGQTNEQTDTRESINVDR